MRTRLPTYLSTGFGAFVDIGVHQDGLVHISALSEKFVKDPHEVVKAGDLVRVKVLEVDVKRQRIALTMRLGDTVSASRSGDAGRGGNGPGARRGSAGGSGTGGGGTGEYIGDSGGNERWGHPPPGAHPLRIGM